MQTPGRLDYGRQHAASKSWLANMSDALVAPPENIATHLTRFKAAQRAAREPPPCLALSEIFSGTSPQEDVGRGLHDPAGQKDGVADPLQQTRRPAPQLAVHDARL
jgi:hypothetical protein